MLFWLLLGTAVSRAVSSAREAFDKYFFIIVRVLIRGEFLSFVCFSDLTTVYEMSVRKQNYTNSGNLCSLISINRKVRKYRV